MSHFGLGFIGVNVLADTGDATATLSGTQANGNTLTCTFNDDDPDGAATGITYQWFRDAATTIVGQTASTYTLTSSDTGHTVKCRVNYTDAKGFSESIFTASSGTIGASSMTALTKQGDTQINNQLSSTFTFSAAAIGTAAADRWVFCLFYAKNANNRSLTSCVIGGVTATVKTLVGTMTQQQGLIGIAFANVPTGTTANIVFTWNGGNFTQSTANGMGLTWYTTNGALNTTETSVYSQNANTSPSNTFSVPANGGFAIFGGVPSVAGTPSNDNNLTTDRNYVAYVTSVTLNAKSMHVNNATAANVNKSLTCTGWTGGAVNIPAIGYTFSGL